MSLEEAHFRQERRLDGVHVQPPPTAQRLKGVLAISCCQPCPNPTRFGVWSAFIWLRMTRWNLSKEPLSHVLLAHTLASVLVITPAL